MHPSMSRRLFLRRSSGAALLGGAVLLGACSAEDTVATAPASAPAAPPPSPTGVPSPTDTPEGAPIVADVVDFSIQPQDWEGSFGYVTLRLHRAAIDGNDAYFVRTDTSDEALAGELGLVHVPKLAGLANTASGTMFSFPDDDHPDVISSEPGRDDYTPAWTLRQVRFTGTPASLGSVADVETAAADGTVEITETDIVVNAGVVKWSDGEMPVDAELNSYLGGGQLIEAPDTQGLTAMFKLHECYPGSWYFPLDHSLPGPAENTNTVYSPGLQDVASQAGATGVTNVFANGLEGPGPMGFQPSAFDFAAGAEDWSPYWDHFTYEWNDGADVRVLDSMAAVHEARDGGELTEYPGAPPTDGTVFTVNCPVPVLGPSLWTPDTA